MVKLNKIPAGKTKKDWNKQEKKAEWREGKKDIVRETAAATSVTLKS